MRTITSRIKYLSLATGLITVVAVANLNAGEPPTAGVVRISDKSAQQASNSPGTIQPVDYTSESYITNNGSFVVQEGPCIRQTGNCVTDWFTVQRFKWCSKRGRFLSKLYAKGNCNNIGCDCSSRNNMKLRASSLSNRLRCKFGYFYPTGCCGTGCPLIGTYNMVYAVDPQYFDERDGKLYSAQGHGVPMAVPLAPTVRHSYNYGWGIPSSRRTPISRVAPQVRYINPQ